MKYFLLFLLSALIFSGCSVKEPYYEDPYADDNNTEYETNAEVLIINYPTWNFRPLFH